MILKSIYKIKKGLYIYNTIFFFLIRYGISHTSRPMITLRPTNSHDFKILLYG